MGGMREWRGGEGRGGQGGRPRPWQQPLVTDKASGAASHDVTANMFNPCVAWALQKDFSAGAQATSVS